MNFWHSLAGEVTVELLTADPAGVLEAIAVQNIPLYQVQPTGELTVTFRIRRRDYRKLKALTRRRGEKLTLKRRLGIYWRIKGLKTRPVLLLGLAFALAACLWIPTRVFFFRVEGNRRVPTGQILSAAEDCGMTFGASRRLIRSEKVKNRLLSALPDLKWAGINTQGCVAVIRVAEKPETVPMEPERDGLCHIVAARDGILTSLTVTSGTALCTPGQAVVEGQVLISGLTDCGIAIKAQAAQGEVSALTARSIRAFTPETRLRRGTPQKKIRRWSLILGKKRVKLWFGSGIWDAECGRMYREYPLCLPGGFCLPVTLAAEELTVSDLWEETLPAEEAQAQLQSFAKNTLLAAMLGGTLQKSTETLSRDQGAYLLTGFYSCREVISRPKWEQIGDMHD